jgi:diguanylate cyclase (GGDEF)-like protein
MINTRDELLFRLGGEEFGVFNTAKKESYNLVLASKARANIEALFIEHIENAPSFLVTASFGVAIILANNLTIDHKLDYIYKKADDKLYEAKENGRNKIEYEILK